MLRQWFNGKTINSYSGLRGFDSHWVYLFLVSFLNLYTFLVMIILFLIYFNFDG